MLRYLIYDCWLYIIAAVVKDALFNCTYLLIRWETNVFEKYLVWNNEDILINQNVIFLSVNNLIWLK